MDIIHDLYKPEAALVEKLTKGESNDLPGLFSSRTKRWRHPFMHCESGTIGTFGDLSDKLSPIRAFALIPMAITIALEQADCDLFATALSLLFTIARASQTTEIHPVLLEKKDDLYAKVMVDSENTTIRLEWDLIREWYRL